MGNQDTGNGSPGRHGTGVRKKSADPLGCSIEDILSEIWANEIGFPLPEKHMLSRVALYHRYKHSSLVRHSNKNYLKWLKNLFLDYAEFELPDSNVDEELRKVRSEKIPSLKEDLKNGRNYTVSHIADELGYLKASPEGENPLAVLASLKLPLYITTSPFDFLERAIADFGPDAHTQICFRTNEPGNVDDAHKTIDDLNPAQDKPVVYHLYGLEDYPRSMVLNEDQYLEFLPEFFSDSKRTKNFLPTYVGNKVTLLSLLLLGYRLRDLEFRVMLKGLIGTLSCFPEKLNLAIQLDPEEECPIADAVSVKSYLRDYFGVHNFKVLWRTSDDFMAELYVEWQKWNQQKGH